MIGTKLFTESCGACGRPGRQGNCFRGAVLPPNWSCNRKLFPGLGYPFSGIPEKQKGVKKT